MQKNIEGDFIGLEREITRIENLMSCNNNIFILLLYVYVIYLYLRRLFIYSSIRYTAVFIYVNIRDSYLKKKFNSDLISMLN